jgi:hypothetical protein
VVDRALKSPEPRECGTIVLVPAGVDSRCYPQLAEYLLQLPAGIASYPECTSRGTLVVSAIEGHDVAQLPEGLPPEILALLDKPPLPGTWVPAVYSDAVFYALVDTFYPDENEMLRWTTERTLRTAKSKMYRALTRVAGPTMLLRMVGKTHGMFQRGTTMHASAAPQGMDLRLEHPPYLHGGFNHRSNTAMIDALLRLTAASDVRVEMSESTPTHAEYRARWR